MNSVLSNPEQHLSSTQVNMPGLFSDSELSKRLERAEGLACVQFAEARRKLFPESDAAWMNCDGTSVVYDGAESPITQTFGLGLHQPISVSTLETIERFFKDRNSPTQHEVSPFAGVTAMELLTKRNYRPIEISNVLYCSISMPEIVSDGHVRVSVAGSDDAQLWAEVSASGWSHEYPELEDLFLDFGEVIARRGGGVNFLAALDGIPGAAASLSICDGVALFAGAATVPAMRNRGLQSALLRERMRYAAEHGCDVASIVTLPGSSSQRNSERNGFHVAYTRVKWRLD